MANKLLGGKDFMGLTRVILEVKSQMIEGVLTMATWTDSKCQVVLLWIHSGELGAEYCYKN